MKSRFYSLLFVLLLMFNISNVKASECDRNDVNSLKELAKTVTYNYNYVGEPVDYQLYNISFDNIEGNFYIKDKDDNIVNKNLQVISTESGNRSFRVYSTKCNVIVRTISVDLPKFNERYLSDECNGLEDVLDVCGEWYQGTLSDDNFINVINKYYEDNPEESNNLIDNVVSFATKHYYLIGVGTLILIIAIILLIIRHRKRSRLD